MAFSDYTAALTAFASSPSESTKLTVLTERAKLPDQVQGDGGLITLPNLSTLTATLDGAIAGAQRGNRRRLIRTGFVSG